MLTSTLTQAFDGDYQIIFSDSFNIYENLVRLTNIAGYTFEFVFEKGAFDKTTGQILSTPDEVNKKVTITIKNFRNTLGSGSTIKLPIIKMENGKQIFFSVYGKSLSSDSDFLNVTINFYLK